MALSRFVLPYADVGAGIRPSSGAKLFFYATGTSTPKNTFNSSTGSAANTNPVISDANGVFPAIFLEGIFNVVLKDANDVQIWTADPVSTQTTGDVIFSGVTISDDFAALKMISTSDTSGFNETWLVESNNNLDIQHRNGSGDYLANIARFDLKTSGSGGLDLMTVYGPIAINGQSTSTAGDFNIIVNTALSDADSTFSASQLIGGEFTITPTAARIKTCDSAANIISALAGSVDGSHFIFTIVNLASFNVTIATATGITLVGDMVVGNGNATFRARRLSSSTVSITRLEKANPPTTGFIIVRDEKSSGTSGGTFTTSAWRTRDLNVTSFNNIPGASLSANRVTLPAGTYVAKAIAPAYKVGRHKIALFNITDTATISIGTSQYTDTGGDVTTSSSIEVIFVLASEKVLELQHKCQTTQATNGFGVSTSFSDVEVYSNITFEKIG